MHSLICLTLTKLSALGKFPDWALLLHKSPWMRWASCLVHYLCTDVTYSLAQTEVLWDSRISSRIWHIQLNQFPSLFCSDSPHPLMHLRTVFRYWAMIIIYCCNSIDSFALAGETVEANFAYLIFWESLKQLICSSVGLCYTLWTNIRRLKCTEIIIYCSINIVQHLKLLHCYFLIGSFMPTVFKMVH